MKWKQIVQIVLDIICAVWLAILSVIGSGCSSSGHINSEWDYIFRTDKEQYIYDFYNKEVINESSFLSSR